MSGEGNLTGFKYSLSLEPLLDFWRAKVAPGCPHMAEMFRVFEKRVLETPELQAPITGAAIKDHLSILMPLMSVVFPPASWETELAAAIDPVESRPFHATPRFQELLVGPDGRLSGRFKADDELSRTGPWLRAFYRILEQVYGIPQGLDAPVIKVVPDPRTGLDRLYRVTPDLTFLTVRSVGRPPKLSQEDRKRILDNITDLEVLARHLPPEKFEHHGFVVIRAVDVTEPEIISSMERDLISQESIFSLEGFNRLLGRLRTLFNRPRLWSGLAAVLEEENKVLLVNSGCTDEACAENPCEAKLKPTEVSLEEAVGSIFHRVYESGRLEWYSDLAARPDLTPLEREHLDHGLRALMVVPLIYEGRTIGTMDLTSTEPHDLGPMEALVLQQVAPLFSMALKRGLDERERQVQAIIKEKCTAVHPSVEWRFGQAARAHLDRVRAGQASNLEPIVFKEVIPLFGQCDIRGSSEARNKAVQADLKEQLQLVLKVFDFAAEVRPWPLLKELRYRTEKRIKRVEAGVASGDETSVARFIELEAETAFPDLLGLGPRVVRAVEDYRRAVDPHLGLVYRKRREFEESVSRLNARLSSYLDREQAKAQAVFPHYFEKHQTDGLDYVIYVGASMFEAGRLSAFHLKNLGLWQFLTACGLARQAELAKPELKVPLQTCHLILLNQTPLAIRFRYDEKRFDVDGAYDIRQEIIKSRLDKATIKGGRERLTQPGRIAVVYTHPDEGWDALRHIDFLRERGDLLDDLEEVDLDDLPGVKGLKALRVGVNLEAGALSQAEAETRQAV